MEQDKPFVFGNITSNTEPTGQILKKSNREKNRELNQQLKQEKLLTVEKEIDTILDGYYCKDRVEHPNVLCDKKYCKCKFKKESLMYVKLQVNKKIIQDYYTKNNIKDKFNEYLFKYPWRNTKSKFSGKVDHFIRNCKFIYDLDLLVDEIPKDKTATETYNCKDRVPHHFFFCSGRQYIEDGIEKTCRCDNYWYTEEQLKNEVMKEWIIKKKDEIKLSVWDKIALTFDWDNLSDKQVEIYNRLLLKSQKHYPQPTKKVKRKKITP